MSLEFTENKSNIDSGALNDLMFIIFCRVIGQWLPTRQSVGDQLGSDRQPIGDRSATGWRLYLGRLFLIAESLQLFGDQSATDQRLVDDQSATKNCVGIVCNRCRCNRCKWSAISRPPVGNLPTITKKPFYNQFGHREVSLAANQNLLATKSSLQPSATSRRPVADLLATALQPPCDHPKFCSQGGRQQVASYVWPGLYPAHTIYVADNRWWTAIISPHLSNMKEMISIISNCIKFIACWCIHVSVNCVIIASGNGFSPAGHQAITWTNYDCSSIEL